MDNEVTNPSPVPGTQNVVASGSTENAASVASLKDVVKQATGREYPTDEEALKGIQETYKAVTARHEPAAQVQTPEVNDVQLLRHELKVSNWYQDHPEYKDVKDIIGRFGSDPEKVVTDPSFLKVYGALKQANESQNKTVLTSNSRLATPRPDDYAQDLAALRAQQMPLGEFLAKHKGVSLPTE